MAFSPDASPMTLCFWSHVERTFPRVAPSGRSNAMKRPFPRTFPIFPGNSLRELLELLQEEVADDAGVLDEVLLLDDLEVPPRPDHVDEVAAPGRVDAGGDREDVLLLVEDPLVRREAADLHLLPEGEEVGHDADRLEAPHPPGEADAGLDLVEDEEHLVLVAELPERGEELGAEVVVASLALDRLDDEGRHVVPVLDEGLLHLRDREGLDLLHALRSRPRRPGSGASG